MAESAKILLVDDDAILRGLFSAALLRAGYQVIQCADGHEALEKIPLENPALIVLDVEMPRMNGWKTLAELRQRQCPHPVLMITHVNDVESCIRGLDMGADEYLGKPCGAPELLARVRAMLRRAPPAKHKLPSPLRFGTVVVDLDKKTAVDGTARVRLTRLEFALLQRLSKDLGKPVSRDEIFAEVWGGKPGNSHTLDTHIWRLRRKLGDTADEPRWIRNLPGVGYTLDLAVGTARSEGGS